MINKVNGYACAFRGEPVFVCVTYQGRYVCVVTPWDFDSGEDVYAYVETSCEERGDEAEDAQDVFDCIVDTFRSNGILIDASTRGR